MQNNALRRLVQAALLAALTCVATMVIQIPSPMQGFINLGDALVLFSGWLLGPTYGFLAAAIGSGFADIIAGYAHYAVATFIIKGLMAMLFSLFCKKKNHFAFRMLGATLSELLMVVGYFVFAALLLGNGWGAAASIPGNLFQGFAGLAGAELLITAFSKTQKQ